MAFIMHSTVENIATPTNPSTAELSHKQPATRSPSPDHILQTGLGFWAAKTLLSAVELGVFTQLAGEPLDAEALRQRLGLHPRSARDFFDALVALKLLERHHGKYANTPDTDLFLDRQKPTYAGGILEMCNARLYRDWGALTEGLRTGRPQNQSNPERVASHCQKR